MRSLFFSLWKKGNNSLPLLKALLLVAFGILIGICQTRKVICSFAGLIFGFKGTVHPKMMVCEYWFGGNAYQMACFYKISLWNIIFDLTDPVPIHFHYVDSISINADEIMFFLVDYSLWATVDHNNPSSCLSVSTMLLELRLSCLEAVWDSCFCSFPVCLFGLVSPPVVCLLL